MDANNEGSNVVVHFNIGVQHYANEVTAHWRLTQGWMHLTMVSVFNINDSTLKAVVATILVLSPPVCAHGVSHQFVKRYIRRRLGEKIHAANDENVENFAQVVPEFLEFTMPALDVMEALEWQEQD